MYYLKVHEATKKIFFKKIIKRLFDFFFSLTLLCIFFIPIILLILISSFYTKSFGLFTQKRVGEKGNLFTIFKIRTINKSGYISNFGSFLRKSKLDELPQLYNIVVGEMSFVGPRPDIEGFADKLVEDDRVILSFKPGLTGPATIKFFNEELDLKQSLKPKELVNEYWKEKVKINKEYVLDYKLSKDIYYLNKTIIFIVKNLRLSFISKR